MVKSKVDKSMMKFLVYGKPVNSQIITEDLIHEIISEQKAFPEELFRQLYEITLVMVEKEFTDYNEYVKLQMKFLI